MLSSAAVWLVNQVVADIPQGIHAEYTLSSKTRCLEQSSISPADPRTHVSQQIIWRYHEAERDRRLAIEDKARVTFVGIALALTVIFAGLGLMTAEATQKTFADSWGRAALVFLLLAVIFFLVAAIAALRAMELGQVYSPTLHEEAALSSEAMAAYLLWCIELNQLRTLTRANNAHISYLCVRNAVIWLGMFILVAAVLLF